MIKIIQLVLFIFILALFIFSLNNYFLKEKSTSINEIQNKLDDKFENNQIKDLSYEVELNDNTKYVIKSDLSNISNDDGVEIIDMEGVKASFSSKKLTEVTIVSDKAKFNNKNYYTNFINNVKLQYIDNIIYSDNADINFDKNEILIFNNVKYNGGYGSFIADNIKIDLVTKNIYLYMNDSKKDIIITSKN